MRPSVSTMRTRSRWPVEQCRQYTSSQSNDWKKVARGVSRSRDSQSWRYADRSSNRLTSIVRVITSRMIGGRNCPGLQTRDRDGTLRGGEVVLLSDGQVAGREMA